MVKFPTELASAFPMRERTMHKYDAGKIAVVGGSHRYPHAPVIACLGARAAGGGLIQCVAPASSRLAMASLVPEATFVRLAGDCALPSADVTVVGMGLGLEDRADALVRKVLSGSAGRFVLDADALTLLARWCGGRGYQPRCDQTLVITPHVGEAARLLGCDSAAIMSDRTAAARSLAERYHAVAVLKGAGTVVASSIASPCWVCDAGNPFMALGGMGDLLAGMIGARWARLVKAQPAAGDDGKSEWDLALLAAKAAVWLHASAADDLVGAETPVEPNVANVAAAAASIRIKMERS